jgi:hypothetical protein
VKFAERFPNFSAKFPPKLTVNPRDVIRKYTSSN